MKYILMFVSDDSNWDPSKPEIQAAYKRIGEWFETNTKSGKITGGEELKGTATATTVRQRNGHVVPRNEGDGLFSPRLIWKRRSYASDEEAAGYAQRIRAALEAPER